ncbi:Spy/CpxP family protein refolding chaperone [Tropicimonas sp. S265A]|uniref:Spy/CpxP family protein refolding chaperone n=1 Tax=Tropicimonas sp. S265A TaxID=3415134 RepID=UPI003C7B7629
MKRLCILLALTCLGPTAAGAQHGGTDAPATPYAGLETRDIKSLSDSDIEELRRGGGWGLALPAELNGKPGPAHLLELQAEMDLSDEQVQQITRLFEDMRREAMVVGERLISAEAALSTAFENDSLGAAELERLIEAAETARAELRFIHLSRHLATVPLLTQHQIQQYQVLRGYTSDPCANIPDGHNPEMWKKHNGCL